MNFKSCLLCHQVIAAEGEQKASYALKEAADVLNGSPFAIQLRYLQTLGTISAEKNSTIIFPLPVDMVWHFMKRKRSSTSISGIHSSTISAVGIGGSGGGGGGVVAGGGNNSSDSSRGRASTSDNQGFVIPPPARRRQIVGGTSSISPSATNEGFAV